MMKKKSGFSQIIFFIFLVVPQISSAAIFERASAVTAKPIGPGQVGVLEHQAGFSAPIVLNTQQGESLRNEVERIKSQEGNLPPNPYRPAGEEKWRLVTREKGTVKGLKAGAAEPQGIWSSRMLKEGDWIMTGPDNSAIVTLANGVRIRVMPNTVIRLDKVQEAAPSPATAIKTSVTNFLGRITINAQRFFGGQHNLEVTTPMGVIGARGTIFETEVLSDKKTIVRVFESSVEITTKTGRRLELPAGKQVAIEDANGERISPAQQLVFQEPFQIIAGTPAADDEITLWTVAKPPMRVIFNRELNEQSVTQESVFVADKSGRKISGITKIRRGDELVFYPSLPLEAGRTYLFTISRSVNDRWGNALQNDVHIPYRVARGSIGELKFALEQPRFFSVTKVFELVNNGPDVAPQVELSLSRFRSTPPNMYLQFEGYSLEPNKLTEDAAGNVIAHWTLKRPLKSGEHLKIEARYKAVGFFTDYTSFLAPGASSLSAQESETAQFLLPEKNIESDAPEIRALAKQIVGDETDPLKKAEAIYHWIVQNITYDILFGDDIKPGIEARQSAVATLKRKTAVCYEFANLFTALARASGVPTRVFLGWPAIEEESIGTEGHAWPEFYIPGRGWIPTDPTWGAFSFDNFNGFSLSNHIAQFLEIPGKTDVGEANRVRVWYPSSGSTPNLEAYFYVTLSELVTPISGMGNDEFFNALYQTVSKVQTAYYSSVDAYKIGQKYFADYESSIASAHLSIQNAIESYPGDKIAAMKSLAKAAAEAKKIERSLLIRQSLDIIFGVGIGVAIVMAFFIRKIFWKRRS